MTKVFTYGTKVYTDENKLKEENMSFFLWLHKHYRENNYKTSDITKTTKQIDKDTTKYIFTFKVVQWDRWLKKQFTYTEKVLN